jgi:hypothetical protein
MMHDSVEALLKSFHNFSVAEKLKTLQIIRRERLKEALPELSALFNRERHLDVKREILKAFADIGGSFAVDELLNALHSPHEELRLEAVRRLARMKPAEAKKELCRILEGEEWDLIRLILPIFEPPYANIEDLPLLVSVAQRAPNPTIKYLAIKGMNSIQRS